jgi:ribosomal protein S18 acetylase RimI-like enzyme
LKIRPYAPADEGSVVDLWIEAKRVAYPYLESEKRYGRAENLAFFRDHIARRCEVWLAESQGRVVGFAALDGSTLDRLYVLPAAQRSGVGEALLARARERSPAGLSLYTHQQNVSACAFYEKHGFRPVRFGTSPPPESMPDVEYRWRPS